MSDYEEDTAALAKIGIRPENSSHTFPDELRALRLGKELGRLEAMVDLSSVEIEPAPESATDLDINNVDEYEPVYSLGSMKQDHLMEEGA